jgi:aminopeptidase N
MSHLGSEWTNPEFRSREKILNEILQFSMITDAGINSHPLKNDAYTQAEISSIFSDITYEKGGSIVRMIEGFLTEITFQKGLKYYLDEM